MKIISLLALWVLCQIASLLVAVRFLVAIFFNQSEAWNIALGYDRLGNAAANDYEVETISHRAALARNNKKLWGCVLCKFLNVFQKDHCDKALT